MYCNRLDFQQEADGKLWDQPARYLDCHFSSLYGGHSGHRDMETDFREYRLGRALSVWWWPDIKCRSERRSEEHTSELQSRENLVCRLLLEKKKNQYQE